MDFWKLLIVVGTLLLLGAAALVGLSLYEASVIDAYTDAPVGQSLIIPLAGAGLIAIGYGIAYKRRR